MKQKYIIPEGKYEEKHPEVPEEQIAKKAEVQEVLEILLEVEKTSGKTKPSLADRAREFRKHMDEMEADYERNTTHVKD